MPRMALFALLLLAVAGGALALAARAHAPARPATTTDVASMQEQKATIATQP
jgi:hypothetical protein